MFWQGPCWIWLIIVISFSHHVFYCLSNVCITLNITCCSLFFTIVSFSFPFVFLPQWIITKSYLLPLDTIEKKIKGHFFEMRRRNFIFFMKILSEHIIFCLTLFYFLLHPWVSFMEIFVISVKEMWWLCFWLIKCRNLVLNCTVWSRKRFKKLKIRIKRCKIQIFP